VNWRVVTGLGIAAFNVAAVVLNVMVYWHPELVAINVACALGVLAFAWTGWEGRLRPEERERRRLLRAREERIIREGQEWIVREQREYEQRLREE
jgi:uncharacterized membrane protein YccC